MFDVRVIPIGAVGTGARAWQLSYGHQIAGIRIDNKSGSWLLLNDGTFVPPYTIGFGHSFQPTLASIDVLFANGPAGQVTTRQGDNPVVTIYSEPVGESPGVPSGQGTAFVQQFTPILSFSASSSIPISTGSTVVVVAAIANQRFRLLTWGLNRGAFTAGEEGPCTGVLSSRDTIQLAYNELEKTHLFPEGLDFPVGTALTAVLSSYWTDVNVEITGTYMVI